MKFHGRPAASDSTEIYFAFPMLSLTVKLRIVWSSTFIKHFYISKKRQINVLKIKNFPGTLNSNLPSTFVLWRCR